MDEWMKILPGTSNLQSTNDHAFRYPYLFCRDGEVPDRNESELFWFFYKNKIDKVPISNPWTRNLGKLIMPDVFVDVDLLKELIKSYNPVSMSFNRKDRSIFLALDKETFIEAFDLGGQMLLPIEMDKLKETFKQQKTLYMGRAMTRHIPMSRREKGEIPKHKEVDDLMSLKFFQDICKILFLV